MKSDASSIKSVPMDQLLYEHDKEILVLKLRLNSLEQVLNKILNKFNIYWGSE